MTHPKYGDFLFGDARTDSMDDVCHNPNMLSIASDIASGVEACEQHCDYFGICGGGAPVNKLCKNGTFRSTETMHCRLTIKAVADVVLEDLECSYSAASPK